MNVSGRKLLLTSPVLVHRGTFIAGANAKIHALLAGAVASATFEEPVRRILDTGDAIYVIRASVIEAGNSSLIALSLRDTSRLANCAPLQDVFGVTLAEQRVLEHLVHGLTIEAAAEVLGSSILTVRSQIKHAYAKLGVSTREELFARLLPFLEIGSS